MSSGGGGVRQPTGIWPWRISPGWGFWPGNHSIFILPKWPCLFIHGYCRSSTGFYHFSLRTGNRFLFTCAWKSLGSKSLDICHLGQFVWVISIFWFKNFLHHEGRKMFVITQVPRTETSISEYRVLKLSWCVGNFCNKFSLQTGSPYGLFRDLLWNN